MLSIGKEPSKASYRMAVDEQLVSIIDIDRTFDSDLFFGGESNLDGNSVPGIAGIARMATRSPTLHVIVEPKRGIQGPALRRKVDCFPVAVLELRRRP